jgi:hypothetical protein
MPVSGPSTGLPDLGCDGASRFIIDITNRDTSTSDGRRQVARPMPLAPPVTRATLF